MKPFQALLMFLLLMPAAALAQGVRMSADFLPLAVGNRWIYDVTSEEGAKVGELDMAVQEHSIVDGRSFYVFTRFPFVATDGEVVRMIRYDRQEREFLRIAQDEEAHDLVAGIGIERAALELGIVGDQPDRFAAQARERGDRGPAEARLECEITVRIDDALQDFAHVVDLRARFRKQICDRRHRWIFPLILS